MSDELSNLIGRHVRDIPDYPEPGVLFKDITPLLDSPDLFRSVVVAMAGRFAATAIDRVVGLEARGFLMAAPVALELGAGLVPVRKEGKLPAKTLRESYDLEYGTATVEMHADAITPGDRVLVIDDVLATGGTARAAMELVRQAGGTVVGISVLMELTFLQGREKLPDVELYALSVV